MSNDYQSYNVSSRLQITKRCGWEAMFKDSHWMSSLVSLADVECFADETRRDIE